jgi:hypothetical protein
MLRCFLPAGALLVSLLPGVTHAQPLDPRQVPPALAPWIPWVLRGAEQQRCPALPGDEDPWDDQDGGSCAWAGPLHLELTATGGRFTQSWEILAESDLRLPGDEERCRCPRPS